MQVCNWWLFFRSNGQSVTHGVRAHVRLIIVYLNEKILTITFALVVGQVVLWREELSLFWTAHLSKNNL